MDKKLLKGHMYFDGNTKKRIVPTSYTFYLSWVYYDIANWYAIAYGDCCFAHIFAPIILFICNLIYQFSLTA